MAASQGGMCRHRRRYLIENRSPTWQRTIAKLGVPSLPAERGADQARLAIVPHRRWPWRGRPPVGSAAARHAEGAFGLSQLTRGAAILAQRFGRRLGECDSIGVIAQLLQVADECLQSSRVTTVRGQHSSGAGVESARIFAWRASIALCSSDDGPRPLATRHQECSGRAPRRAARQTQVKRFNIGQAILPHPGPRPPHIAVTVSWGRLLGSAS